MHCLRIGGENLSRFLGVGTKMLLLNQGMNSVLLARVRSSVSGVESPHAQRMSGRGSTKGRRPSCRQRRQRRKGHGRGELVVWISAWGR
jgi:hypothetical protein